MRTRTITISQTHPAWGYLDLQTRAAKNLYNRGLFLVRNVYTGLRKPESERFPLEQQAIDDINRGLENTRQKYIGDDRDPSKLTAPTKEEPVLDCYILDAALKGLNDRDYYALPAQVNQQVLEKLCEAFDSFFAAAKEYKEHPEKFSGRPGLPKYLKKDRYVATFTNQVSKLSVHNGKEYLSFPKSGGLKLCIGGEGCLSGRLIRTEAVYRDGVFRVNVTYEDGIVIPERPGDPSRVIGIDLGVKNFAAIACSFDASPCIISGKYLQSVNQCWNKFKAKRQSLLPAGAKSSRAIDRMSVKRENRIRDFFYKSAHKICRMAAGLNADVIVVGWNKEIKTGTRMGKVNNQNFVCIPFYRFCRILTFVAEKYGIPVIVREESYTSKASFLDMDHIYSYGDDVPENAFSGVRSKRKYTTRDGIVINADINGAANIARKEYPQAFSKEKDYAYLTRSPMLI